MFRNYFNVAIRSLFRKKAYTFINILGLATGIAFCLLIYLYVQHERSFDTFHAKAENLYRLETSAAIRWENPKATTRFFSFLVAEEEKNALVMPIILASELKTNFPEVEQILRFKSGWNEVVKYNNQSYKEEKVLYTDTNFFQLFSFPLLQGDPTSVLASKNNVVITQSTARKYFGNENPMGKTMEFSWEEPVLYTVTGVAADIPANSSLQFDFLLPIASSPGYDRSVAMGSNVRSVLTIVELAKGASVEAFEEKLDQFGKTYFDGYIQSMQERDPNFKASDFHVMLRPFADGHYNLSFPWGHYTSLSNIYQLICLTFLILLIACLNYILLTLTNTAARSQEVSLRKVIGAARRQIILQFWMETQVIVFLAVLLGWVMATIWVPYFNNLIGSNIQLDTFHSSEIILTLLATTVIVGTLAGFYPAFFISGFKPLGIIRQHQTFRLNPMMSRVMVVVQYTTCIALLIASLVIARQMNFMNEKDLGFDQEQILVVENPDWGNASKTSITWERLQAYAATDPGIAGFSGTGHTFGYGYDMNLEQINGKEEGIAVFDVDHNYFDMLDLEVLQGRNFSLQISADTSNKEIAVVINKTLFNMLGETAKIGEYNEIIRRKIIGVVEDYHYNSVAMPIGPAMHQLRPQSSLFFWFRLRPDNLPEQIERVKKAWNAITDNQPFGYTFLDQDVAKLYESQQRWMKTINASTAFAILVSCLGLFGLSGMNALNRVKEIGIRKVLGASVSQVFFLLNKDTIQLTFFSFAIAIPVAAYFMHLWLQNFAYRIDLGWEIFAIAGGMGVFAAILAVSYHSLKAAMANPVESLRNE